MAAPATAAPAERVGDPHDWCGGHGLPESMCTLCNPELVAQFKASGDWCAEHQLPESVCPKCNPMQPPPKPGAAPAGRVGDAHDWCGGHGLPESMCTLCNPELVAKFKASGDWCAAHQLPESVCPKCNPMQPPPKPGAAPAGRVGDAHDWCGGHGLPESMCTLCNPELVAKFKASGDWCAAHQLPESVCPKCNPMQPPPKPGAAPAPAGRVGDPSDWCGGHGLPESMCTLCNPELVAKFKASGDWCAEHGLPESVCPQCNPMQPPPGVALPGAIAPGTRIRFRDPSLEAAAGIQTVLAVTAAMGRGIEATARVDFDRNAIADIRAPVPGIVQAVHVDLGDLVVEGAPLFTLASAAVGDLQARRTAARARVTSARADLKRQRRLREGEITSQQRVEQARAALAGAEADLRSIEQSLRLSGARGGEAAGRYVIASPIDGRVVRRAAVVGTSASEAEALAVVAETTTMWALVDVPEWQASAVAIGSPVELAIDGIAGRVFKGRITWLASEVDRRSRAVTARAEVHNPDGLLRAGQFARATITVAAPADAVVVPVEAVQRVDTSSVIFVREGPGLFVPRVVEPGRGDRRRVQVAGDVRAGEAVVTTGAFLLRTELSRESIGAGCCEVEGPGGE